MKVTDERSGISVSSNGSEAGNRLLTTFAQVVHEMAQAEQRWIAELRASGVKAAHPDDGWVDRKEDKVHFAYPQFNDGVMFGDKIALGWPEEYRIVKVIGQQKSILDYWVFK